MEDVFDFIKTLLLDIFLPLSFPLNVLRLLFDNFSRFFGI
jgi:hypothetical protein